MDKIKISVKDNYSKVGKFTAQKFSYIMNRSEYLNQILKDKPRKRIVEEDFLDKKDNESLDRSEDKDSIDIFDSEYQKRYYILLEKQRSKYLIYTKSSCSKNKNSNYIDNKNDENNKKFRYHILHHNQLKKNKKMNEPSGMVSYLDQNQNKNFIYHKIAYSQSFHKMIGRNDKEAIRKFIEKNLDEKNKKINTIIEVKKNDKIEPNNENDNNNEKNAKKNKISKNLKKLIKNYKGVEMDKQLMRGSLPSHHDVRIRTAKGLDTKIKNNNKIKRNIISGVSSAFYLNRNNNMRIFSSTTPMNKTNLIINNEGNTPSNNLENRLFSGTKVIKNANSLKNRALSSSIIKNKIEINSGKRETQFNSDKNSIINNRTFSSGFKKLSQNMYSDKNNSYSLIYKSNNINFHNDNPVFTRKNNRKHCFSSTTKNRAISFKKMLSRQYVNRLKHKDKIDAEFALTPKYSLVYPKVVTKVMYKIKNNFIKKKEFKGLVGEQLHSNNPMKNTNQTITNFSKMFGRGKKIESKYPMFMNNLSSRNIFDIYTDKSLKMNYFLNGKLNNPFSSFNNKKSFNNIISQKDINNKNRSKSNNIKGKNMKENRLNNYNENIENIFNKVVYDNIVDERKNEKNEELFDLTKNPRLAKKIDLSYKNLISDYYRLNFDFLEEINKDKIDGVTFEVIKNNKN